MPGPSDRCRVRRKQTRTAGYCWSHGSGATTTYLFGRSSILTCTAGV